MKILTNVSNIHIYFLVPLYTCRHRCAHARTYAHIYIVLIKSNKKYLLNVNKKINRVRELETIFGFDQTNNMLASMRFK